MPKPKQPEPTRVPIDLPRCSHCGGDMILTRIEPEQPGQDRRTFECKACGRSESKTMRFRAPTADEAGVPPHPHALYH
jgi:hypothetical protein